MPMIIHLEKSMVKMAALVLFGFISTIRLNIAEKMRQHIASTVTCLVKKSGKFITHGWHNWNIF